MSAWDVIFETITVTIREVGGDGVGGGWGVAAYGCSDTNSDPKLKERKYSQLSYKYQPEFDDRQ
jgi:hypothetical protein